MVGAARIRQRKFEQYEVIIALKSIHESGIHQIPEHVECAQLSEEQLDRLAWHCT